MALLLANWKPIAIILLVMSLLAGATLFISHYKYLEAQAALVGPLQKANQDLRSQIKTDDTRAGEDAKKIKEAYAAVAQAIAEQEVFHELAGKITNTLQEISKNATASKNPVCLPSDRERLMFNAAVSRYLNTGTGSVGQNSSVPASTH